MGAYEPDDGGEFEVAEITEVDEYVTGQDSYRTTITVNNRTFGRFKGTLYHAGECFLAGSETGFGARGVPSKPSVACTVEPANSPPGRYMAFTPGLTPTLEVPIDTVNYVEGKAASVWSTVDKAGTQFPDTVAATSSEANGMGLSWSIELGGEDSDEHEVTLSFTTTVSNQKVISDPAGPLTSIHVDDDLGCQVQASGDAKPSFFGGAEPGACGTLMAFIESEDGFLGGAGSHVFGPGLPGIGPEVDFMPEEQTLGGKGTESQPYVITTRVRAMQAEEEEEQEDEELDVAELTETDSYVTGQDFYTTKITIKDLTFEKLAGTLYHAGRCLLSGLETGFGAQDVPAAGSVACTIEPADSPPARLMALTPLATGEFPVSSAHFLEAKPSTLWSNVGKEAKQFPDTVDAATKEENAIGLSWPIELSESGSPGDEATLGFTTAISPTGPPTSTSTAAACVPSGQVPVTVSAVNGAKAVDYVLDGAPVASAATNAAGLATISLSPGQHTLEFWGEDETGAQESQRHVLSITVASGGPSLTISSDQGRSSYRVGESASVTIAATGPGLTVNPSAAHVPISTATAGSFTVTRTAADACGATSASFSYTVAATPPLPPPVLGKSVNVEVVSGKVLVALPATADASFAGPLEAAFVSVSKGLKFIPLIEARQIPVGSTLETTAGVARVTTATASQGKTQSGEFGAGIFKLLQSRKQKGLTELNIIDNHSYHQVCASIGKKALAAKLSARTEGRLTGSAHGNFRTKGQYSAATVRGTVWGVTNQCDGTLTKVTRGEVKVRDFLRRKTITLFTGQSYLAKAPR